MRSLFYAASHNNGSTAVIEPNETSLLDVVSSTTTTRSQIRIKVEKDLDQAIVAVDDCESRTERYDQPSREQHPNNRNHNKSHNNIANWQQQQQQKTEPKMAKYAVEDPRFAPQHA